MLRWLLNNLNSALLIVLITGGAVGLAFALERFQRHRMRGRQPESSEMLGMTVEFVGIAYAILIGFVIVSLWDTQGAATDIVSDEAAALSDIGTLTRGMAPADSAAIRAEIIDYGETMVDEEFEMLRDGEFSARAQADTEALFDSIIGADVSSPIYVTMQDKAIDTYKDFSDLRTKRLQIANDKLAGELWLLVLVSSLALILLVAAFEGEGRWDMWASLIISGTVGLVLFAMVALSYPFSGDLAVTPGPFAEVVRALG